MDSLLNPSNKGNYMTKKTVPTVKQRKSKSMALPGKASNVSNASVVSKPLFGKGHLIKNIVNNIGFDCGCKRASLYGSWFKFLGIVSQNLNESRTTGLIKHPTKPLIMEHTNT